MRDALGLVVRQAARDHENAWDAFAFLEEGLDQHPEVVSISGDQDVPLPHRELKLIQIGKAAPAYLMDADGIQTETPGDLRRFGREVFVE